MRNSRKGQIKESGNRTKAGSSHAIPATASSPAAYSAAKSCDSGARTDCPRTAAKTGTGSSPFGYSRSCCGNSCRWISDSPFSGTPPKEDSLFNYIYIAACVVAVFMIMSSNMVLIGLFPITLTYLIHYYVTKIFNYRLRSIKFKFIPGVNVTVDDLYNRLQPSLFQRYGSQMEFDRDNEKLSVKYNGIIYDILMEGNGTFRLWWRKDVTGIVKELIFFTYAEFRLYNRARAGMGILAYEIQRDFGITK